VYNFKGQRLIRWLLFYYYNIVRLNKDALLKSATPMKLNRITEAQTKKITTEIKNYRQL